MGLSTMLRKFCSRVCLHETGAPLYVEWEAEEVGQALEVAAHGGRDTELSVRCSRRIGLVGRTIRYVSR